MNTMTHMIGLKLQIFNPADYCDEFMQKICGLNGVTHAKFSKEYPDVVVIEYDPYLTNSNQIYQSVEKLNGKIRAKVFL